MIENKRGEKVKFCTYRSDDRSLVRPRKCWMLDKGQRVRWNRGDSATAFDVRIFGPGVFELPICMRREISNSYQIEVAPRRTRSCVTAYERTVVPPQSWAEGARVLVNRLNDNFWYPATVLQKTDNKYRVRLDNMRLEILHAKLIADLVVDQSTPLQVNWKNQGRWYPVRLKELTDRGATVIFDDGSEENTALSLIRIDLGGK